MGPAESDAVNQPLPGHLKLTVEPAQGVEIPLAPFFQYAFRLLSLRLPGWPLYSLFSCDEGAIPADVSGFRTAATRAT